MVETTTLPKVVLLTACVSICLLSGAASAQSAWQPQVGNWSIRAARNLTTCYAESIYQGGTRFQIELSGPERKIGFKFSNPAWDKIQVGKAYPIRFVFDSQKGWNGNMTGAELAGTPALAIAAVKEAFFNDFMNYNTITFQYNNQSIGSFSLRGTSAALTELRKCHSSLATASTPEQSYRQAFAGRWECRQYIQESGDYFVRPNSGWIEIYTDTTWWTMTARPTPPEAFRITSAPPASQQQQEDRQDRKEWTLSFDSGYSFQLLLEKVVVGEGSQKKEVLFRATTPSDHVYICNKRGTEGLF